MFFCYNIFNNCRDIFTSIHYQVVIKHTLCKTVAYICNTSINITNIFCHAQAKYYLLLYT